LDKSHAAGGGPFISQTEPCERGVGLVESLQYECFDVRRTDLVHAPDKVADVMPSVPIPAGFQQVGADGDRLQA
jgi:hypothetical protein